MNCFNEPYTRKRIIYFNNFTRAVVYSGGGAAFVSDQEFYSSLDVILEGRVAKDITDPEEAERVIEPQLLPT